MALAAKQLSGLASQSSSTPSSSIWQLPPRWQREFLQLYRKLLRETTYLPDSQCRTYHRSQVISRFRRWHPRNLHDPHAKTVDSERRALGLHRNACQKLRMLAAANDGAIRPLQRVMDLAYGRVGEYRHKLLAPYLSDPPKNDLELRKLAEARRLTAEGKSISSANTSIDLPRPVTALAKTQIKQAANSGNNSIKRFPPKLPDSQLNGTPLSPMRLEKLRAVVMDKFLSRLLPPLPECEWQRLRDLVTGTLSWSGGSKRRPRATAFSASEGVPLSFSDLKRKTKSHHRPHTITPRFMQRRYEEILLKTPLLKQDPSSSDYTVTWYQPPAHTGSQGGLAASLGYFPPNHKGLQDKNFGSSGEAS